MAQLYEINHTQHDRNYHIVVVDVISLKEEYAKALKLENLPESEGSGVSIVAIVLCKPANNATKYR